MTEPTLSKGLVISQKHEYVDHVNAHSYGSVCHLPGVVQTVRSFPIKHLSLKLRANYDFWPILRCNEPKYSIHILLLKQRIHFPTRFRFSLE